MTHHDQHAAHHTAHAPLYIALEGVKGSGKSTLLTQLIEHLTTQGFAVVQLGPTHPAPWWTWRELLARLPVLRSWDRVIEELYAGRSSHAARRAAREVARLTQEGRSVVILGDRSFYTSLVTRWERVELMGEEAHWAATRAREPHIPLPHVVVYLDISIETLLARLKSRARGYGLRDERPERLISAHAAYERLMSGGREDVKWVRLSAESPHLLEDAIKVIQPLISP